MEPLLGLPRHENRGMASGWGEAELVQAEASPGLCCIHGADPTTAGFQDGSQREAQGSVGVSLDLGAADSLELWKGVGRSTPVLPGTGICIHTACTHQGTNQPATPCRPPLPHSHRGSLPPLLCQAGLIASL